MRKWRGRHPDKLEKVGKIRKKSRKVTHASDLEEDFEKDEETWDLSDGAFAARVVEVHKRYVFVSVEKKAGEIDTKDVWLGTIARKYLVAERSERNFVSVGDRVLCQPTDKNFAVSGKDLPNCVIQHAAPRKSRLARLDPHTPGRQHVLAVNMDYVAIVASYMKPKVKWGLIDRYLVLAELQDLPTIIVLNKRDLLAEEAKPEFAEECRSRRDTYRQLGYDVFEVQANADDAEDDAQVIELKKKLSESITLFTGHSGVGKSSLVNLFDPEIVQIVEPDEDIFYKGRHTTTFASFIRLGTGGFIIDTPGIRSFTFAELSAIELSHGFVEMRPLMGQCKYRECRHIDEPDCVVREAVRAGKITEWRYRSYLGILLGATGREGRLRDIPDDRDEKEV